MARRRRAVSMTDRMPAQVGPLGAKSGGRAGSDGLERFGMPPRPGSRRTPWRHGGDADLWYREKRDFEGAKENLEAALKLNPQLGSAKKALDDVNELIARNAAAASTAPVSPPAAAPITMPSDRWIVSLLGLALAFIVWIGIVTSPAGLPSVTCSRNHR